MLRPKAKSTNTEPESFSLPSLDQYATQPTIIKTKQIGIPIGCSILGTWFYYHSLEGGSDQWLFNHIGKLAFFLISSLILYLYAYIYTIKTPMHWSWRGIILSTLTILMYSTLQYDQGASFQHHGEYNLVVFLTLFILIGTTVTIVHYIRKYKLYKYALASVICLIVIVNLMSISARANFSKGILGGELKYSTPGCDIPQITPWAEFVPRRFWNFFTGPEYCNVGYKSISSYSKGVLTMDCPKNQSPYYVVNPNFSVREEFIEFHDGQPTETSNLRRVWNDVHPKDLRKEYTGPVKITAGSYIQTFCGKKEGYHVINVRNDTLLHEAQKKQEPRKHRNDPNIVMIVIDSLSRAHFMRRLHKTIKALESLDESNGGDFNVLQFFRYHSVTHSTPGNLRPLFSGFYTEEIIDKHAKVDPQHLLWKQF